MGGGDGCVAPGTTFLEGDLMPLFRSPAGTQPFLEPDSFWEAILRRGPVVSP